MKTRSIITTAALAVAAIAATALPASAAGQVCYDLHAEANGDVIVSESGCEELPL